jgi:hypothetical protein
MRLIRRILSSQGSKTEQHELRAGRIAPITQLPNLDPNNPNAIIDVEVHLREHNTSNYQTNLDPNKPNTISAVDPGSSVRP